MCSAECQCCSDRAYKYNVVGQKLVTHQKVDVMWRKVSDDQLPFPSEGIQFATEEQYRVKGWCCFDAAKDFAIMVIDAEQVSMRRMRNGDWLTYNELCQKFGRRL